MKSPHIAVIYSLGKGNPFRVIPTGPNRKVEFRGGSARVSNPLDMPRVLQMPDVQVEVAPEYLEQLPHWAEQCPVGHPAVARVVAAGRDDVTVGPAPEYALLAAADAEPERKPVGRPRKEAVGTAWTKPAPSLLDNLLADVAGT